MTRAGAAHRLLDLHRRICTTLFAAHTHTQPAQPTTSLTIPRVVEQLERDVRRLQAAYATRIADRWGRAPSPAPVPIDLSLTSDLLASTATGNK